MNEKYKELVNTILTQFADNEQMTYSILGSAIEIKIIEEIKETIRGALRFRFDDKKTSTDELINLTKAMKFINKDDFLEMISDLEHENIKY